MSFILTKELDFLEVVWIKKHISILSNVINFGLTDHPESNLIPFYSRAVLISIAKLLREDLKK